MIKAVPTTHGDSVAPPRPDRGTTSLQLPAPLPPAVRIPAARAGIGPDAVPVRAAAVLPADALDGVAAVHTVGMSDPADGHGHVPSPEAKGCLFALSQPPLMLFLV